MGENPCGPRFVKMRKFKFQIKTRYIKEYRNCLLPILVVLVEILVKCACYSGHMMQ